MLNRKKQQSLFLYGPFSRDIPKELHLRPSLLDMSGKIILQTLFTQVIQGEFQVSIKVAPRSYFFFYKIIRLSKINTYLCIN